MGKIEGKNAKFFDEKMKRIEKINEGRFSSGKDMLFIQSTFYQHYRSRDIRRKDRPNYKIEIISAID